MRPVVAALLLGLAVRLGLIWFYPEAFAFDGYQRWAAREHLLVQDWLPATQAIIASVALLGGNLLATRVVLSLVGALAGAAGTLVAVRLGERLGGPDAGRRAGWFALVASIYGPFTEWSTVLYQEGTFLFVLFSALALALSGHLRAADVVIGAMGLVRYEGWPCVALYVLWRRDPRALVALWGIVVWLSVKFGLAVEPFRASPVNFADWEGLGARFDFSAWWNDVTRCWSRAWATGGGIWLIAGVVGLWRLRREHTAWLLAGMLGVQLAATGAWIAGLEMSTSRMLIIPVALASTLGGAAMAWLWTALQPRWLRIAGVAGLVFLGSMQIYDAARRMAHEARWRQLELAAIAEMDKCAGCVWWIEPRRKLGTRQRHDGCEVIQGMSNYTHGKGFWCGAWVPEIEAAALYNTCSGTIRWDGTTYVIERHLPGGSGAPPAAWVPPEPSLDTVFGAPLGDGE